MSDHTPGHSTVLGAITLGARVIEKHFTDANNREGPDHKFSMNPKEWRLMVDHARELEDALGGEIKKIEDNEKETFIIQRRSIRAIQDLFPNTTIKKENLTFLRPCPTEALKPSQINMILNKKVKRKIKKGDIIRIDDLF